MNQNQPAAVNIYQVTQGQIPGTEFNHESFKTDLDLTLIKAAEVEDFYIATNASGEVVGTVSNQDTDRSLVASLMGNWIAAGHKVSNLSRKDLLKRLRIIPVAAPVVAADSQTLTVAGDGAAMNQGDAPAEAVVAKTETAKPETAKAEVVKAEKPEVVKAEAAKVEQVAAAVAALTQTEAVAAEAHQTAAAEHAAPLVAATATGANPAASTAPVDGDPDFF